MDYYIDLGCAYALDYDGLYIVNPQGTKWYHVSVVRGSGIADMSQPYRLTWYGLIFV